MSTRFSINCLTSYQDAVELYRLLSKSCFLKVNDREEVTIFSSPLVVRSAHVPRSIYSNRAVIYSTIVMHFNNSSLANCIV